MFANDLDKLKKTRGCIIYVKEDIACRQIEVSKSTADCVWVEIRLMDKDILKIGCVYRSPNNTNEADIEFNNMISECNNSSHILVAGDFNMPRINWADVDTAAGAGRKRLP